jgi:hypothetical protein
VHRFRQGRSSTHVFDQPDDFDPGFYGNPFDTGEVFFDITADLTTFQISLERPYQPALPTLLVVILPEEPFLLFFNRD